MLDVKERRTKLEELLGRVQKNRTHRTEGRLAPAQAEPAAPVAAAAPVAVNEPLQETVSMRKPEKPQVTATEPTATIKEPSPVEEVRQYETTPTSSGAVAVTTGQKEREWTVPAILERAWKLGSPE